MKDYSKNLFDFMEAMFNKTEYATIDNYVKRKHSFMVNRFFSKLYPLIAHKIGVNGINGEYVCDMWHNQVGIKMKYSQFRGLLTHNKGIKNVSQNGESINLSKNDKIELMRKWKVGTNTFAALVELHPDEVKKELEYINKAKK